MPYDLEMNDVEIAAERIQACKCGAAQHESRAEICAKGHSLPGNTRTLVTGERSTAFWREQAGMRRHICNSILADNGYDDELRAPVTLRLIADGIAQAALVRDAAFERMVEAGGPLTAADRERGPYKVWGANADRVARQSASVGFKHAEKPVVDLALEMAKARGER